MTTYAEDEEMAHLVADAIIFFVGGAEIHPEGKRFRITSKGYYHYVGA
jgi:hypothetical protein